MQRQSMDPVALSLLLLAGAIVLLVGELLLPTHGVLGLMGLFCLAGAIGVTFYINRWLGFGDSGAFRSRRWCQFGRSIRSSSGRN